MADNNINFKLTIDGVEKSFTDVNKLKTEINNLETTTTKAGTGIKGFASKSVTSFKEAAGGVNIMGTSLSSVFKMILANPIGILIGLIGGLIASFKQLEPVANFIEGIISGISAAFTSLIGGVGGFINAIANGDGIIKAFNDNISNIGSKMADSAKSAYDMVQALDALEDAARANSTESIKLEGQINRLILQSKDRAKSDKERIELLKQAAVLEETKYQNDLKIAKEAERIAKVKYDDAVKNGKMNDVIADAYTTKLNARLTLENSHLELNERIANRMSFLNESILADKQKEIEKEKEKLKVKQEISEWEDKIIAEGNEKIRAENEAASQKEIDDLILHMQRKNDIVTSAEQILSAEVIAQRKLTNEEIAKLALMSAEEQKTFLQNIATTDKKTNDDKIKNSKKALNATSDILGEASSLAAEGSEEQKALAAASTLINTYQAAQNAFTSLSEIPVVGVPLGIAAAGAAIAAGLKNVQMINSTPVPKFEKGGYIGGNSHKMGGTIIEAEKGEYIINKNSMSDPFLAAMAKNINNMGNDIVNQKSNIINNDRVTNTAKVYVLESDITRVQNRINVIESNSIIK